MYSNVAMDFVYKIIHACCRIICVCLVMDVTICMYTLLLQMGPIGLT